MSMQRKRGQGGYSMVEMMIAMAITTAMIAIIFSMIEEAMTLSLFVESHNDLTTMSQKALNTVQTEVLQSRLVFFEDAIGTPYRQKIDPLLTLCGTTAPCASSSWKLKPVTGNQLPALDPAPTLAPDPAGTRYTGNSVLVARQLQPVSIAVIADPGDPVNFPALTFFADRYRFEYFYLTFHNTPSHKFFRNGDHILDFWQVRSVEYADYFQLANATGNMTLRQRQDLSTKLRSAVAGAPNLQVAWNPGDPYSTAFWTIDNNLDFGAAPTNAVPLGNNFAITLASGGSLLPALIGGRIGGKMDYSVAYIIRPDPDPYVRLLNGTPLNDTKTNGRNPLPLFAENAGSLPNDCGLEVKVAGPQGARQVMTRLVLYSNYRASRVDSTEAFVITSFNR
jgi:hypothetical protein